MGDWCSIEQRDNEEVSTSRNDGSKKSIKKSKTKQKKGAAPIAYELNNQFSDETSHGEFDLWEDPSGLVDDDVIDRDYFGDEEIELERHGTVKLKISKFAYLLIKLSYWT